MKYVSILVITLLMLTGCQTKPENMGKCPQPRFTGKAPAEVYDSVNPYTVNSAMLVRGKKLYQHSTSTNRIACARCHGEDGDGVGPLSHMFDPPPRNFTCDLTIKGVPDGQLYWIIKNGSPGTSMPGFEELNDEQLWSLVAYLRKLANQQFDG